MLTANRVHSAGWSAVPWLVNLPFALIQIMCSRSTYVSPLTALSKISALTVGAVRDVTLRYTLPSTR